MTGRMCLVLGMGLGGIQSASAEGNRPPPKPDYSHTNQDHFGSPGGGIPRDPKGPSYIHTNQDGMVPPDGPPDGPPEAPPDGEESRLGNPFEYPFDVPNSTLGPTSVLVVAERLGGTPSPWAANTPLPEAGSSPGLGGLGQSMVPGPAGLLLFLTAGLGTGRRSRRSL